MKTGQKDLKQETKDTRKDVNFLLKQVNAMQDQLEQELGLEAPEVSDDEDEDQGDSESVSSKEAKDQVKDDLEPDKGDAEGAKPLAKKKTLAASSLRRQATR